MTNFFSQYGTILLLVAIIPLFYFFLIRPQKKQEQAQAQMRNSLQVGDEITTIGGIIGKITSIKGETVTIETSKDKTKIRFLRTAIRSVDVKAEESVVPAKKTDEAEESKSTKSAKKAPALKEDKAEETAEAAATAEEKPVVLNGETVDTDDK